MSNTAQNTGENGFAAQQGKGRPKGVPNKNTAAIRDMIVQALDQAGGVNYLIEQSEKNPVAFMGLVGKVLPMQVTGEDGGPVQTTVSLAGLSPAALREIAGLRLPDEV